MSTQEQIKGAAASSDATTPRTAPRRMTRAEEIAAGRRRRSSSEDMNGLFLRLGVDPATKDANYEYRWINDADGRLQALTQQDDWDFVENHEAALDERNLNDSETRIKRQVGTTKTGEPMWAYWCRKYKPWYDEDMRKQAQATDARHREMIQRQNAGGAGTLAGDPSHTYIPAEGKHAIKQTLQRVEREEAAQIRRAQRG